MTQEKSNATTAAGNSKSKSNSRRDFIITGSSLVAGGVTTGLVGGQLNLARAAHPYGQDEIKIGLVGCGGRGTGAAVQALNTTSGPVKIVAMGDVFADRLQSSYRTINSQHADKCDVPEERRFIGLDSYKQVLDSDADLVILATPPGFRPMHFEAAVEAGKHIFMEKPVAVDGPGVRRVLAANEIAKKKNLAVAVGLQRHHEVAYRETISRLQDGAIGDIVFARAYWNGGGVWVRPRQPQQTELEYQMRNWYYFNWLCGDHIVEQHIHNLDVINWLKDGFPVKAQAQGGREVRKGKDYGQIFDHHSVEYTYADGTILLSQCRHIKNCCNSVSEHAHGTKGSSNISGASIFNLAGEKTFQSNGKRGGHQEEHHDLFRDLRNGVIPNEAEYGAKSTMTSILGRMASYTGAEISWDAGINSELSLCDVDGLTSLKDDAPLSPSDSGDYFVPAPGNKADRAQVL